MNKINSIHCETEGFSQKPLEFSLSPTSSVESDTNMGTKGSFLHRIPPPLVSSQLDHMVGAGSPFSQNPPQLVLQNCNESYNESYTFFVTFGSMVEGYFGC